MIDIIDSCLRVNQLNQVLDNLDNILLSQHTNIHIGIEAQLLVDTITTYITQVVTLI